MKNPSQVRKNASKSARVSQGKTPAEPQLVSHDMQLFGYGDTGLRGLAHHLGITPGQLLSEALEEYYNPPPWPKRPTAQVLNASRRAPEKIPVTVSAAAWQNLLRESRGRDPFAEGIQPAYLKMCSYLSGLSQATAQAFQKSRKRFYWKYA